ncbi:hypothetical protein AAC387_Pa07g3706 [Persea americana]
MSTTASPLPTAHFMKPLNAIHYKHIRSLLVSLKYEKQRIYGCNLGLGSRGFDCWFRCFMCSAMGFRVVCLVGRGRGRGRERERDEERERLKEKRKGWTPSATMWRGAAMGRAMMESAAAMGLELKLGLF